MRYSMILGLTGLVAVNAHPQHHAPNTFELAKRGIDLEDYSMPSLSSYTKTSSASSKHDFAIVSDDYVAIAIALAKDVAHGAEFRVVGDHYVDANGVAHINLRQTVHGLDIDNADFNINVKDGKVFSYGNSFYTGKLPAESPLAKRALTDPVDALKEAIKILGLPIKAGPEAAVKSSLVDTEAYTITGTTGAVSEPKVHLTYFQNGSDELTLTWRVETDVSKNWLLSYVDATTGQKVHGVVDYVNDLSATFQVYPWGVSDPVRGERQIVKDPWLSSASEFTWFSDGGKEYDTTRGNNGIAQENPTGNEEEFLNNYRPVDPERTFEYPYSPQERDHSKYKDASITQLFYTANKVHDVLYTLGFTEKAGNFETNNNNQGGAGNDMVVLNTHDGASDNNAFFGSPPDGENGRMFMGIFDGLRDSTFDSGVVIHEYVHGLSNRLTGGPANAGCLASGEAQGMGEGWSDIFAVGLLLKPSDTRNTDVPMGPWISNRPNGIRSHVYSTNTATNPLTYRNIVIRARGQHAIGTIWATTLYEVLWNLIDKHGIKDTEIPTIDAKGKPDDGRFLALKLFLDGMALQPCSPDFIAARDAIIDADEALTGGENKCELWKGFSKRGLGPAAVRSPRKEDFTVPQGC